MIAFRRQPPDEPTPRPATRGYFALAAWAFLACGLAGLIGAARLVLPEEWVSHLSFVRLRPLHTFFALYGMLAGLYGMVEAILPKAEIVAAARWARIQRFAFVGFGLVAGMGIAHGWTSGREYLGWAPSLTPLLLLSLAILLGRVATNWTWLGKEAPEGFWLLGLGLIFTLVGLIESQLYLFEQVGGDLVRNLSVQWHGLDTIIAGINAGIYGGAICLTSQRAKSLRPGWLFAFAAFSLLFTFSHHHYLSPQPSFLKWLALAASLIAALSFVRHGTAVLRTATTQSERWKPLSALLFSAEVWTVVAMGSGILFALPNLNLIAHGTHLILIHAMGSMIGINFLLIVMCGFIATGSADRLCRHTTRWGLRSLNLGLVGLWIALGTAGWIKGTMRLTSGYADYNPAVQTWLIGFPILGAILMIGLFLLSFELLGACENAGLSDKSMGRAFDDAIISSAANHAPPSDRLSQNRSTTDSTLNK